MNAHANRQSVNVPKNSNNDGHSEEQMHLFQIAFQIKTAELPSDFIVAAILSVHLNLMVLLTCYVCGKKNQIKMNVMKSLLIFKI